MRTIKNFIPRAIFAILLALPLLVASFFIPDIAMADSSKLYTIWENIQYSFLVLCGPAIWYFILPLYVGFSVIASIIYPFTRLLRSM